MKEAMPSPAQEAALAKARFLRAAAEVAPLTYVRANPLRSVSCSFLLGLGLSFLRRGVGGLALVPLLLQTAELADRLGLLEFTRKKERTDD